VTRGGTTVYVYADPTGCEGLYRGNATAYRMYRTLVAERASAAERQRAAEVVEPESAW
jgi:hypothetical protein